MKVFVSGGCKNGKSSYAEKMAAAISKRAGRKLYYIATMKPSDEEDKARIARHRLSRSGSGFVTVEISCDILKIKDICEQDATFLLESTTALLANEMFPADGNVNIHASKKIAGELEELMYSAANMVIVSDYIYSDAAFYDGLTEEYRKGLARLDRLCARASDSAIEICYGCHIIYKGAEQLGGLI